MLSYLTTKFRIERDVVHEWSETPQGPAKNNGQEAAGSELPGTTLRLTDVHVSTRGEKDLPETVGQSGATESESSLTLLWSKGYTRPASIKFKNKP